MQPDVMQKMSIKLQGCKELPGTVLICDNCRIPGGTGYYLHTSQTTSVDVLSVHVVDNGDVKSDINGTRLPP